MSRQSEAKNARRKKRRAARDANWIPEALLDELASSDVVNDAAELELVDARITERGWTFDDELSDDAIAIWFYEPSGAEDGDDEVVTTIWMSDADDGEFVHLLLIGTSESYQFAPDEFFEHLDVIESYRLGDPRPVLSKPRWSAVHRLLEGGHAGIRGPVLPLREVAT